ncbi:conserved hypothetical protein [Leptospira interrogans serovar Manilae]|uniref:Uncharacterized protein n=1 Tax=Leptospira interrogans serovar Manilae TaxID=214675 RepID=A0AAQ1P2F3_LEPIR|nr:hypothetical protein LIMLP_04505 [Leptospira interrogans serovar Manilae]AKP29065.1 hypothetical protein LIMHP_04490 [Leptospira interrogans serovar Manilae]EYU64879.1 hypothetical protein CI00_02865 [Leptospira interrogans serovar Manilae]SOR62673.1 conserved hypothetical protein [Leptospira interrogans serovar Manilae]
MLFSCIYEESVLLSDEIAIKENFNREENVICILYTVLALNFKTESFDKANSKIVLLENHILPPRDTPYFNKLWNFQRS